MTQVLAVVGPTASGKSALAAALAESLESEVISADSMQVYKGMAIGTGAPDADTLARAPHHFIGMLEPGAPFSAGTFAEWARPVVERINRERGAPEAPKPAIVAGGSGLYVSALVTGLFEGPARDAAIREWLQREAEREGVDVLYRRLQGVDPAYAAVILPGDLRRIVRALEVHELTGRPLSEWHAEHQRQAPAFTAVWVGIDWPRHVLYERINRRVDAMLQAGLLDEVRALLDAGYGPVLDRLRSLGYREMAAHLLGELSLDEAAARMKQNTRRFAKRQLSWFRQERRIRWIRAGESLDEQALRAETLHWFYQESGTGQPAPDRGIGEKG